MMNRKLLRRVLSIILMTAVIALTVFYFTRHRDDLRLITTVSMWPVAVISLLKLLEIYLRGRELKILTDHYHLNLRFSQWFGLIRIMAFTNLFLPSVTGTSLKAVYLKKLHHLSYSSFIALTGITNVLRLMIYSLFASCFILISGRISPILMAVAGLLFAGSVVLLLFGHFIPVRFLPLSEKLSRVLEEWATIRKNRRMIAKIVLLNIFMFASFSLQIYYSFLTFQENASVLTCGIISSFTVFSRLAKVLPANLGVKEAIFSAISDFYGLGVNEGLHAAALHRIIGSLFILLLAPGFMAILGRRRESVDGISLP